MIFKPDELATVRMALAEVIGEYDTIEARADDVEKCRRLLARLQPVNA